MESNCSLISAPVIVHSERYHNSLTYALPSDREEAQRLQMQHISLRIAFNNRVVLAPVELSAGAEVLDIGTGTGSWPIDFVSTYPDADRTKVLCIDIGTRLFPQSPPLNITFQYGDIVKQDMWEWENRFAFVHQRLLIFALKYDQWDEVIGKIYRLTARGGWAQLLEGNFTSHYNNCGPATARAADILEALGNASGLDVLCSLRLEGLMTRAGFVDVRVTLRETPLGTLYGEMGGRFAQCIMGAFRGLKHSVLQLGLVSDEHEYDSLMNQMELEWNKHGCKFGWYAVVGRKV